MLALVREALRTRWFERKWLRTNHNGQKAEKGGPTLNTKKIYKTSPRRPILMPSLGWCPTPRAGHQPLSKKQPRRPILSHSLAGAPEDRTYYSNLNGGG